MVSVGAQFPRVGVGLADARVTYGFVSFGIGPEDLGPEDPCVVLRTVWEMLQ